MGFLQNACKPVGGDGESILNRMNRSHDALSEWGLDHLPLHRDAAVLDLGCGGGANLLRILRRCPDGTATGVDYSETSVALSRRTTAGLPEGKCRVLQGDVASLPFPDNSFDAATAVETVYFWPDLPHDFGEVRRVLKPGGQFLVLCEASDPSDTSITDQIEGMTIYTHVQIAACMEEAGLRVVARDGRAGSEWLCVIGRKE